MVSRRAPYPRLAQIALFKSARSKWMKWSPTDWLTIFASSFPIPRSLTSCFGRFLRATNPLKLRLQVEENKQQPWRATSGRFELWRSELRATKIQRAFHLSPPLPSHHWTFLADWLQNGISGCKFGQLSSSQESVNLIPLLSHTSWAYESLLWAQAPDENWSHGARDWQSRLCKSQPASQSGLPACGLPFIGLSFLLQHLKMATNLPQQTGGASSSATTCFTGSPEAG